MDTDDLTPVQKALEEVRERVLARYDDGELDLNARAAIDDILDEMDEEGWK